MRTVIGFLVLMFAVTSALAGEVTLAWDPSVSENVTGYKLHIGSASRMYSKTVDTGNVLIFKLTNLADGTHYFAATAYDSVGNESDYSNEVSATLAPNAFEIKTLAVSMRWFGVILLCTTSQNASAVLRYTDLDTGEQQTVVATLESNMKLEHRAILNLNMGTVKYYRYEWTVTNADGTTAVLGGTFQVR